MKPRAPQTIGIIANTGKTDAPARLTELLSHLQTLPVKVILESETARLIRTKVTRSSMAGIGRRADLLIVLGGDGTILRTVRETQDAGTPILGINLGNLGFLTTVRCADMASVLPGLLSGHYRTSSRHTLQATLIRRNKRITTITALNDAVISRGNTSRIIRLSLEIDGERLTEYLCDGMIFATATGSTAYSLSAGGPILLPSSRALIATPICPHALGNRSIVAAEQSVFRCAVTGADGDLVLTVDGQVQLPLRVGDEVEVKRAGRVVRLVAPPAHSHFAVLRQKLKWSGANV
jgi:NAD+ kinase